jgi:glucitol operon activator protein
MLSLFQKLKFWNKLWFHFFHFEFRRFCIGHQVILLLVIFTLMSLQNILSYFLHIRQYQKMIRKWLGKGILGIGQRRGLFSPGEILILVYDPNQDAAITVQSLRGFSIFVRFKEKPDCTGLSLKKLRSRGIEEDRRDLKLWRFIFEYDPEKNSKRKGALIQAVEAVEKHLKTRSADIIKQQAEQREEIPVQTVLTDRAAINGDTGFSGKTAAAGEKSGSFMLSGTNRASVSNNFLPEKENAGF